MKAMMRSEMESESEGEVREEKEELVEENKLLHITVSRKGAQHKQIQLGHLTNVQLLSN